MAAMLGNIHAKEVWRPHFGQELEMKQAEDRASVHVSCTARECKFCSLKITIISLCNHFLLTFALQVLANKSHLTVADYTGAKQSTVRIKAMSALVDFISMRPRTANTGWSFVTPKNKVLI
jgi:hypothetical protein